MRGKYEAPREKGSAFPFLAAVVLILVVILIFTMTRCSREAPDAPAVILPETQSTTAATTLPEPEKVISTATVGAMGDLLMHRPIFTGGTVVKDEENGTFNFDSIFRYIGEYTAAYDYMAANLETTFGGDGFPYQGNPTFNCPDSLLDSVRGAGIDMLLTANNHSYDTLMTGINRTVEQVRAAGLTALGTRLSDSEDRYTVVDVNGIRIGMVCYTYTMGMSGEKPLLNNNSAMERPEQINFFSYNNLNKLYTEMETILSQMDAQGADVNMVYIHWGTEYEIQENATQNTIAQKLCDMGVDVIVGGHPHVVQPVELLTSNEDPTHKTICIYSLGNAVSNQRIREMRLKTGHTEDGALFTVTFEKYSDGTVYVAEADVLPTWVNFHAATGESEYNILPLDDSRRDLWQSLFALTDAQLTAAEESYDRTVDIVGAGLDTVNQYLQEQKLQREQHYLELALAE